jgi:hypothetical protein
MVLWRLVAAMKLSITIALLIGGMAATRAQAAPATCVRVTAADASDADELRRALAVELPALAHVCLDVALVGVELVERGSDVELTAHLQVMVSDGSDRIAAVLTGRATLRAGKREARRQRALLQRDVLDGAIASVAPSVRARLRHHQVPTT